MKQREKKTIPIQIDMRMMIPFMNEENLTNNGYSELRFKIKKSVILKNQILAAMQIDRKLNTLPEFFNKNKIRIGLKK